MSLLSQNLKAFMAIIEAGTVVRAASLIGLTQTGVTQRIRSLEKDLGVTLFIRSRQGMRPTLEGEALVRYCQRVNELEGETLSQIYGEDSSQEIRVKISGASSIMRSRVIPKTSCVTEEFSTVKLTYDLTDTTSSIHKLKKGDCEFALVPRSDVILEVDSLLLKPERYILVGPANWKKRALKEIVESESIIDFEEEDPMTFNFLKKYKLFNKVTHSRHFANNTDALSTLVILGHGYSVLSEEFAKSLIKSKKLINLAPGKYLDFEVALCWYPRPQMPDYFKFIVDKLRK